MRAARRRRSLPAQRGAAAQSSAGGWPVPAGARPAPEAPLAAPPALHHPSRAAGYGTGGRSPATPPSNNIGGRSPDEPPALAHLPRASGRQVPAPFPHLLSLS